MGRTYKERDLPKSQSHQSLFTAQRFGRILGGTDRENDAAGTRERLERVVDGRDPPARDAARGERGSDDPRRFGIVADEQDVVSHDAPLATPVAIDHRTCQ